jgi:hypothetical protein
MKRLLFVLAYVPLLAAAQAVLPTSWNFTTPGISTPPTGWTTGLGTNGNLTYSGGGFSVGGDGLSCRLDATGEFLQIFFAERPGTLSYYIRGTGFGANPPFAGSFRVQESVNGSNWTDVRNFTAMTTTLTRYAETLASATRYVRFFYTDKQLGTNVALDSVMILQSPPALVNMVVRQNTTTLVNNTTFVTGNTSRTVFTIQNTGTATDLRVDSITLGGAHAADFSIGAFDSITPFGGATDTFGLVFNPSANGSRFATVHMYTNDAERNPFTINLYAIGGTLATEPSTQVPSLNIGNLRTHSFTVSFTKATNAEKYIILRKPSSSLIEQPADGVSYKRGDNIGGAQVAFIGTDTASFKPNYILANTPYTFKAFAFNGPTGYENYLTTNAPSQTLTTPNGEPDNYYAGINPALPTFIGDLNNKISVVDTIFYSNYAPVVVNNFLARDTTNGRKVVTCVYSNEQYVYEDPFAWWTGQGGNPATLTREHTFAQSWMPTNTGNPWPNAPNGREYLEYNDVHNLFPAHQINANAKRSNFPFGEVVTPTYTAPTGFGTLGTDANGATVYEPKEDQKGDLARALFYMLVRYDKINGITWRLPTSQNINTLLQWHQQDPPSPLEIARHEYIAAIQKNRNPFIDNPSWVNRINFSNLTYIPDATAEVLTLTAPNGGEELVAGKTTTISWTQQNVDVLKIEYRTSETGNWILISDTTPASRGNYTWTIPSIQTNAARIRISKKLNPLLTDSSNSTFKIIIRSLTLTYPNGGEFIGISMPGPYQIAKWQSQNIDSVDVQLWIEDTLAKNFGWVNASDTILFVPSNKLNFKSQKAKIKLTSNADTAIQAISADYFTIDYAMGVNENMTKLGIIIYPNPSTGDFTIETKTPGEIFISDITGKLLLHKSINQKYLVELPNKGMYFIKLQTQDGAIVKKMLIE